MANERVQWHPAFQAVMRIELEEELDNLDIRDEQLLNKKPLQMDMLVIKKKDDIPIKKNIGRIFKKHNVVEYKSPTDYFGINDFYKVYGYACLYQSNTEHELEIDPDEITITFVSTKYPRKMMNYLKKKLKLQIEYIEPGIYYIKGDRFTMQLIVSSKLSKESNFWLQSLRDDIQDMKEIEEIAERYNDRRSSGWYQAVMNVITHANWEKMEEKKMMCEALRELFADELAEAEKAKKEAVEKAEKNPCTLGAGIL